MNPSTVAMSNAKLRILFIEDNEDDYGLILRRLKKDNLDIIPKRVDAIEGFENALREQEWDAVISDNSVPDRKMNIPNSLKAIRNINPNTPFIIVSGTIGEEVAVGFLKIGANDYILKDNLSRLATAITREIKESKSRAEKFESDMRLIESEENYRSLAESITDMFFGLDRNLCCTYWNRRAEQISGVTARDAVGRNIRDLFPTNLRNTEMGNKLIEAFESWRSETLELDLQEGKELKHYQVSIYPSLESGSSVIIKDITEQKRIKARLDAANNELETFMYRVAHDIRGPVASLMGLIKIAECEPFDEVAKIYFNQAGKMVNRLERTIKALQLVTTIKQEDLQLQETDLRELIQAITKKVAFKDEARQFYFDINIDAIPILLNDANLLQVVFEQIIQNAIDYRDSNKKSGLKIYFETDEKEVKLFFEDNGMGIRDELVGKVFNMFFRGNERSNGEGLGLYLAKNAIEKLGGSITVTSKLNEGTVFGIHLPYKTKRILQPAEF